MEADVFIARWSAREGGAERANYQMFLAELCDVIGVSRPEPAGAERERNDYVFERAVRRRESDPVNSSLRIDLYKKGCFILEAKQSRLPGAKNALPAQLSLPQMEREATGRRDAGRNWDAMMAAARKQAEDYVFLLDASHPAPPFLITCDVGHAFEIYADFTGTGRAYSQFRGRKGFRIYLEDLRNAETRALLADIWENPASLDPARESARVTRAIAGRLAEVSRSLEKSYAPQDVALFVMRCIFCMFAEDVDLLPKGEFTRLLEDCTKSPKALVPQLEELWSKMDQPDEKQRFFSYFGTHLRHFNGNLYRNARAFPLEAEEIGELVAAAKHKWTEVDPAIFGTLLEQALEPSERRKLGAHYTPRAYVVRLVEATVMEPLRADWRRALKQADGEKDAGNERGAAAILRAFHHKLCTTRVLDPACGTANFLYVCLQLMKTLEGEVLEALADHGETGLLGLDAETVGPRQFLGLELNPRAAAIAELVIWIGFLQEHYRTHSGHPGEPILRAFKNINFGLKDGYDAVLAWDEMRPSRPPASAPQDEDRRVGQREERMFDNPRRPDWPEAEFIVGNPPFIGGKDLRARLGSDYAEVLWKAHRHMNESADFVMYWWDRAAELLTRKGTVLRRFGLVTTNSISQVFQRRTIERHLSAKKPISLIYAIPDHPWTKATKDSAAVRIAMTVCEAGKREGVLLETVTESGLDTDEPIIGLKVQRGAISAAIQIGVNVGSAVKLTANRGLGGRGVQLIGEGFIVKRNHLQRLGIGSRPGLESHIKPYLNGRDVAARSREAHVIDFFEVPEDFARREYPEAFQHLLEHVKPQRALNNRASYRQRWWQFGENVHSVRSAIQDIPRYIVSARTARHRTFLFVDKKVVADAKLIVVASSDAWCLALLSSRIHKIWAGNTGGWLGVGNDHTYNHSECFDPFPFPDPSPALRDQLRAVGEELDATRKQVLEDHPDLTMTGLYNVLEKVKAGDALSDKEDDVKTRGLVLILKELHETIDRLTAEAYDWPANLEDGEILARLVALNAERAKEEARGHVRWLRPDYQEPRFGKAKVERTEELQLPASVVAIDRALPSFPTKREEQILAVADVLASSGAPMRAGEIARAFKRGGKRIEPKVEQLLGALARFGHIVALPDGSFRTRERERLAA
ncbi:class I SAM-dependent DNA methyltransferase [Aliihoeflea sp. PC F10.4]